MARPAFPKVRCFQRASDGAWLQRADTESRVPIAEAEAHYAAEYGFPVRAVEFSNLTADEWVALSQSRNWRTNAQGKPVSNATAPQRLLPPPQPPVIDPDRAAFASTVDDGTRLRIIAKKVGLLP